MIWMIIFAHYFQRLNNLKKSMKPIPEVGKIYKFYDDGKTGSSRRYWAKVKAIIDSGSLVSDDLTCELVKDRLSFNNMLKLMRKFDGVRIYQYESHDVSGR